MAFRVNTNIGALKSYYELARVNAQTEKAQLRLSSGKRIQNVSDDTSGFNVGNALDRKVATMNAAIGNIGSAKDMLATGEKGLMGVSDLLTTIEAKLVDASDPSKDRTAIANDITALATEIDSILKNTRFNDTNLLSGSGPAGAAGSGTGSATNFKFQIGATSAETMTVNFATGLSASGGYESTFSTSLSNFVQSTASSIASDFSTTLQANLSTLKSKVADSLGKIGNFVQRLDIKEDFLNNAIVNAKSTTSRLFDTDMALESLNAMKGQILGQSATAMTAQLNSAPQSVLSLFR